MTSASFFSSPPPYLLNISTSKSKSKTFSLFNQTPFLKSCSKSSKFIINSTSAAIIDNPSSSGNQDNQESTGPKIGARVKVNVPLKVYHVPKVPEVDLTGKEGMLKQYVAEHKGKFISANLPYKVEFFEKVEGRDNPVKFVAHLKEDEFVYVD